MNSYGTYLEELRVSRNLSKPDFVEGIMSERQYRRYINDESSIPNDKLLQLIDKIGLDAFSFMTSYEKRSTNLLNDIKSVYSLLRLQKYKDAYDLHITITNDRFTSKYQRDFYEYNDISLKSKLKYESKQVTLDRLIRLIDYPYCLNDNLINMIELLSIIGILEISSDISIYNRIGKYLYNYLINEGYTALGSQPFIMPSIFSAVSRLLYATKKFNECLSISRKGVEYCKNVETTNSIHTLLMMSALSSYILGKRNISDKYLEKLKIALAFKDDDTYTAIFMKEIDKVIK